MKLEIHSVTPDRWPDMCSLFERPGVHGGDPASPSSGCWCMYWRERSGGNVALNRMRMESLVCEGREPGLLAYVDGYPVGWVSVGPRSEFRHLVRSSQYGPRGEGGGAAVWSITCFAVDRGHRGRGLSFDLLEAAVAHAFAHGATSVEAYPHATSQHDYMGSVGLYERAGFTQIRDADKRVVVRLGRPG